jgi:hypothetical protein
MHTYSDSEVLSPDFADHVVETCRAMIPFLVYLNEIV